VPAQERQVDQRQDVVHGVVVLRDPERPPDHRLVREGVCVRSLADGRGGDAGLELGTLQGVRLHARLVRLVTRGRPADELRVDQAGGDDLPAHRVRERDVAPDVQAQPQVGPLRARCPARIHGDEARTATHPLQEVVEEDRMRLPGVAAPQDDEVRLLGLTI